MHSLPRPRRATICGRRPIRGRARWPSHDVRLAPPVGRWREGVATIAYHNRCGGARSLVDDLGSSQGVVLSRADALLRSIETKPRDSQICPLRTDTSRAVVGSSVLVVSLRSVVFFLNSQSSFCQFGGETVRRTRFPRAIRRRFVRCLPRTESVDREGLAERTSHSSWFRYNCCLPRTESVDRDGVVERTSHSSSFRSLPASYGVRRP